GSIRVDGTEVGYDGPPGPGRKPRREGELARIRADIGMVFQLFNLFPHLTALENVMLGLTKVRGMPKAEARARAEHWLARVGLSDRMSNLPGQLSGGQQQRVGIARAVAMEPKVLLLDEITSALDPELVGEVLSAVQQLARDGMTMVVVTHEMTFARDVGTRIVFMDAARVVAEGTPREILVEPRHERLRSFLARIEMKGH
ncbi:MAG: amino acid ABC transporter ATP-binding protein, partial [Alphaproteobacteria bacterium]|nr:amino acid ABC transporter ATP-binding protein [Alphaproteobacteria bacterium]